jgi:hemolysin activation/secretion protein
MLFMCASQWVCLPAYAATATEVEQAAREADRLLQLQQERETLRQKQIEERVRNPSGEVLPLPEVPGQVTKGVCKEIRRIYLDGATVMPVEVKAALLAPFEGHCIGLAEINQLLQSITNYYVGKGYSTTRAYIPEQDMSGGELHILVLEGLVEGIRIEGKGVSVANAFPGLVGQIFNLREFEQGIDQINRLQSNNAQIDIQPGSKPGTSIIVVKNKPSRPWTFNLAMDNTGSDSTGYYQSSATYGHDNLFGIEDYLNMSLRVNPDADASEKLSRSLSGTYGVPFGRWTLTGSVSDYKYVSVVKGTAVDFTSSGVSGSANVRLDRVIFRNQDTKWTLSGGLTRKSSENFINEEKITANSRVLSVADLTSNLSVVGLGGLWSIDLGLSRGVDMFGALQDPGNIANNAPRAQFAKVNYGVSLQRSFKLAEQNFNWQSNFSGQSASNVLYGSEQFLVGSTSSVRGFRRYGISGDSGAYWRNDLSMPMPLQKLLGSSAPNGQIKPYVGYDLGHVFSHYDSSPGSVSGVTAGLNMSAGSWSVQASYSEAVKPPGSYVTNDDKYGYVRIAMDW